VVSNTLLREFCGTSLQRAPQNHQFGLAVGAIADTIGRLDQPSKFGRRVVRREAPWLTADNAILRQVVGQFSKERLLLGPAERTRWPLLTVRKKLDLRCCHKPCQPVFIEPLGGSQVQNPIGISVTWGLT
jgi:hypothetical protein